MECLPDRTRVQSPPEPNHNTKALITFPIRRLKVEKTVTNSNPVVPNRDPDLLNLPDAIRQKNHNVNQHKQNKNYLHQPTRLKEDTVNTRKLVLQQINKLNKKADTQLPHANAEVIQRAYTSDRNTYSKPTKCGIGPMKPFVGVAGSKVHQKPMHISVIDQYIPKSLRNITS